MKAWFAAALFALTLGRHYGVDLLASMYADPLAVRRALFYVMGSVVATALYATVWLLTPWRPAETRIAVALVCWWGILEEGQCVVCRIAAGIDQPVRPEMWRGICDQLSGVPISTMTLALPVFIAYGIATNFGRRHGH